MEIPRYLQVLARYAWLLAIGVVIAAVAGFFAAYTIEDGDIAPRAEATYTASTTLLLENGTGSIYSSEIPGTAVEEGVTSPTRTDLASTAVIYAYLISGTPMQAAVEAEIGEFSEGEELRALRRTTQPGSSDQASGRLTLPVVEIYGHSPDPDRAVEIAMTARTLFEDDLVAEQDGYGLAPDARVILTPLTDAAPIADDTGNPLVPALFTGLVVFLFVVVLIFVVDNIRRGRAHREASRRAERRAGRRAGRAADSPDAGDVADDADDAAAELSSEDPSEDEGVEPERQPEHDRQPEHAGTAR